MYIKELRALLDTYTKKELNDILAEIYKSIPKALKEEHQVDDLMLNAGKIKASTQRHSPSVLSWQALPSLLKVK